MLTWNFSLWTLWRQTAKASSKMNSWELTIFWMYPSVWWSFASSNLSTLNRKAGSIKNWRHNTIFNFRILLTKIDCYWFQLGSIECECEGWCDEEWDLESRMSLNLQISFPVIGWLHSIFHSHWTKTSSFLPLEWQYPSLPPRPP